uniref:G_PROTEIN_RECEP_F1_2 domain-containing protein n=1 Tax=Steinernema glaseri TaxID=37863 RepID=A0A1I7Y5Y0_9BILA
MSLLSPLVIYIASAVFSIIALIFNARFIFVFVFYTKKGRTQLATLFLTVVLHMVYDLSCALSSAYSLILLRWPWDNKEAAFWIGNVSFSLILCITVSSCFISIDRILAMRQPVLYSFKYSKYSQIACGAAMVLSFLASAVSLSVSRQKPSSTAQTAFSGMVSLTVLTDITRVRTTFCVINLLLTVFFLLEARMFLKKQPITPIKLSIQTANQIVFYQALAETVLMIVPELVTQAASWFFGINLYQVIGAYPIAVSSLYTLCCAILLNVKVKKTNASKPMQVLPASST